MNALYMRYFSIILTCVVLSGCAAPPLFPPEMLANVDRTLTFASLKINPNAYKGNTIEFGGQIVGSQVDQHEIRMLVRELPVEIQPVYGPVDTGQFRGMFVVVYQGEMTAQDLQHGNMIIVVGTVLGAIQDSMIGSAVTRPTVQAECAHIWRTQGQQIDDFPYLPTAKYWPLVEQTFCVNTPATLLNLS